MIHYILKGKKAVACDDLMTWAKWIETADRHVAEDTVRGVRVSTVFLGIDLREPLLFETMIFEGPLDQEMDRYSTWEEAEVGHKAMIEKVKKEG